MQNVYKNIVNYNLGKERKVLIFFDDMIADMISLVKFTLVILLLGEELEKKNSKITEDQ